MCDQKSRGSIKSKAGYILLLLFVVKYLKMSINEYVLWMTGSTIC
jgi:hypothetical protein